MIPLHTTKLDVLLNPHAVNNAMAGGEFSRDEFERLLKVIANPAPTMMPALLDLEHAVARIWLLNLTTEWIRDEPDFWDRMEELYPYFDDYYADMQPLVKRLLM